MSKTYKVTGQVKFINKLMRTFVGWGIGPKQMYILIVKGRKSGKLYSTPVSVVEQDGHRWLVAPYGDVGWVRNARAANEVSLKRGKKIETFQIEEVDAEVEARQGKSDFFARQMETCTHRYAIARGSESDAQRVGPRVFAALGHQPGVGGVLANVIAQAVGDGSAQITGDTTTGPGWRLDGQENSAVSGYR